MIKDTILHNLCGGKLLHFQKAGIKYKQGINIDKLTQDQVQRLKIHKDVLMHNLPWYFDKNLAFVVSKE